MGLIETIYDAAFDRSRFTALLRALVAEVDGQAAFLGWQDMERQCGFDVQIGNDPAWLRRYVEEFVDHDVMRPILHGLEEGEPDRAAIHFARGEIAGSLFYRGFIRPQGIVDNLAVNLIKNRRMIATLAILRKGEVVPFDDGHVATIRGLGPHLKRAVLIQSRLIDAENATEGWRQSSAGLRDHVILLNADGEIVEIDPQLSAMLGLGVGQPIGRPPFGPVVQDAIASGEPRMVEIGHSTGDPIRLMCEAQLLARDRMGDLSTRNAAAHAIHIALVDRPQVIAYSVIAGHYRLTPTEARVLRSAVEGGDLVTIGERLGMARGTARTHLHRIYAKTGTTGLVDLCRLAFRFVRARDTQGGGPATEGKQMMDAAPGGAG